MAIFKPSNLSPNLEEIDVTKSNIFSAQVNTQGCNVVAYKISLLNGYDGQEIKSFDKVELSKPVLNKQILKANLSDTDLQDLKNGKDYQWWIRMYNAPTTLGVSNPKKPDTKVCSGFLVGSTTYVIWTKNNEKLKMDRWVEFETVGPDSIFPILEPNLNNITLPKQGEFYRERQKISWVEKELGWDKNFTKLELEEPFKYNYINHTKFKIYNCSDKHTLNSFFVDPNDMIQRSFYVTLFDTEEHAKTAHDVGYLPSWDENLPEGQTMPEGIIGKSRKIIGYGEDTGEIRVQEAYETLPQNGNAYLLFERVLKTYQSTATSSFATTSETGETTTSGSSTSTTTSKVTDYIWEEVTTTKVKQLVGGSPIEDVSFDVITNEWNSYNNTPLSFYVSDTSEMLVGDIIKVYDVEGIEIGYGNLVQKVEGRIDIDTPLSRIPQDGDYFKLFRTSLSSSEETNEDGEDGEIEEIIIRSSSAILCTKYQLFVQPNINIFTDEYNPDEIIFENGVRLQIIKTMSEEGKYIPNKESDITFNKLDNSQWILNYGEQVDNTSLNIPLIPKTTYEVYTSFMDSIPNAFFYARKEPQIVVSCKGAHDEGDVWVELPTLSYIPFRDIIFKTEWAQENGVEIKNFNYKLYDGGDNLIQESGEIYSNEIEWEFKGLANNSTFEQVGQMYKIEIIIVDEHNKIFGEGNRIRFLIQYETEKGALDMDVYFDCDTQSNIITVNAPLLAKSSPYEDKPTFELKDIYNSFLNIPSGHVMNYDTVVREEEGEGIEIPHDFTLLSKIQLTREFLANIPQGGEQTILEISSNETDEVTEDEERREHHVFSLRMGNINRWYTNEGQIVPTDENILGLIHLYKDDNMVENCFADEDGEYNLNSVAINALFPAVQGATSVLNVLQPKKDGKYTEIEDIGEIVANPNTIFLLKRDNYATDGKTLKYPVGLYTATEENGRLKISPVLDNLYVFINSTNEVQGMDYETLEVDEELRVDAASGGRIRMVGENDTHFLWIENDKVSVFYNGQAVESNALFIYMQIFYDENDSEVVRCSLVPTII